MRESTPGWEEVLPAFKSQGMNAPRLAIGDGGAMGFWSGLDHVWLDTRHRRYRVCRTASVPATVPESRPARVKTALQQVWMAEIRPMLTKPSTVSLSVMKLGTQKPQGSWSRTW